MKSKATGVLAVGIASLAVVGTIAVNAFMSNGENSSNKESEVARMVVAAEDTRVEQTNEIGWYIYDINDVNITVSDAEFLCVDVVAVEPTNGGFSIEFSSPNDGADGISETSVNAIITDEFGNKGKYVTYGNKESGCAGIDASSKQFTVTLEFADRDDVTIEITLP